MFERKPILEGRTDIDQCVRIFKLVGSPNDNNMPGWSALPGCEGQKEWEPKRGDIDQRFGQHLKPEGLDLLKSLLCLDYKKRINAFDALQHDYFKVHPSPIPRQSRIGLPS
jgi:serine/threonine-protein kinase BUR1